jgi:hypothetical protein
LRADWWLVYRRLARLLLSEEAESEAEARELLLPIKVIAPASVIASTSTSSGLRRANDVRAGGLFRFFLAHQQAEILLIAIGSEIERRRDLGELFLFDLFFVLLH